MNKITVLSEKTSLIHQFLTEIRDKETQKDRMRFNRNMERIGEIAAYEISKDLQYTDVVTQTQLATANTKVLAQQPVVGGVLRAALPLQQGITNFFDGADRGYISAYRNYLDEHSFEVVVQYLAAPSLTGRTLIFADPMLATGRSIALTLSAMMNRGTPAHIHIVAVVASKQGLAFLSEQFPYASFWIGAVDDKLDSHGYIVPGLGDAGDLAFGPKL